MIYTVTLNPSIDYIVSVDNLTLGAVNRTRKETVNPGGKGINVSMVLKNLGCDSIALGFYAGFTGREIVRLMEERGVCANFIEVGTGISRINVKVSSKEESEINGIGPVIGDADIARLYAKLGQLKEGDILVFAGAVPPTVPKTIYGDMMGHLSGKGLRIVVDAAKELLVNTLKYRPFLVKPNHHELGEIYGAALHTREEVIPYARKLQEEGARNVFVSMAEKGAVLLTENGRIYQSGVPSGEVLNSVGAGDSAVAGFLAGYCKSGDYEQAFYMGLCAGSASAFSEGMAQKETVRGLLSRFGKEYI